MRFLHVIPSIATEYGGPVTTMLHMIDMWNILGYKSKVLTIGGGIKEIHLRDNLVIVPPSFPSRFAASRKACEWLKLNGSSEDLVVFHSSWSAINIQVANTARRMGIRYIVIAHGSLDPFDLQKKRLFKLLFGPLIIKPYLNNALSILCSTQLEADRLETYGAKTQIDVLTWPVKPIEVVESRKTIRDRYSILDSDFLILFLGRIDYKKGFPILLPAFKKLIESGTKAKLLIVGPNSGNYITTVKQMIQTQSLADVVKITNPVVGSDKASLMQAADCFALCSLNENFGNTVVESIQVGTPVVISNNVYIANIVQTARAGIVVDYDINQTFEAFKQIATSSVLRESMSSAAIALGKSFTPESLKTQYAAYADILQHRKN